MQRKILLAFFLMVAIGLKAQIANVTMKDIEGKTVETNVLKNANHPTIISFFATWCKPCLRELGNIAEVYDEWQEETGVKLIAVSIDEGVNALKVKPLIRAKGWDYEVWLDSNKEFMRAMNVTMVPSVFVLDKEGKIVYRHTGYAEGAEEEIIQKVRSIAK